MAKLPLVKCCICQIRDIDRDVTVEDVDYIRKGTKYYHMKCYNDWKKSTPLTDKEYEPFIFDFLSRDLKVKYDYFKVKQQMENFKKQNMTIKGQFFALKYFYEVKKGDWAKGYGGIGIVPYVYQEACTYWVNKEKESNGIIKKIEQQMIENRERKKKVVRKKTTKKKFAVDLGAIGEMENDE